jgi:glycosyltransferase involved in cell wall biosynthesis
MIKRGGVGIIASERSGFQWPFVQSLIKLLKRMGDNFDVIHVHTGNIPDARNMILSIAKERNLDYVVMIDSDMVFPSDGVLNLLKTVEMTGANVCGGLYYGGLEPYTPMAFIQGREPITDITMSHKVESVGMGFTLIDKSMFEVKFRFENGIGEDYLFCKEAPLVFVNPNVRCGHLRTIIIDGDSIQN